MQDLALELQPREVTGKSVKVLRKEGFIPAVIHDHGKESIVVQGEYQAMHKVLTTAGKNHPVQLTAAGKKYIALVKSVTRDPRYHSMTHVVFNAVKADQQVDAEVPVHIKLAEGNDASPAERSGLVVLHQLDTVQVEALPKDLPDALYFDGEKLQSVGDQATVADLIVPKGVVVKVDPAHVVATVFEPSALQAANDAAGGAVDEATATVEAETGSDETAADTENKQANK